jgi:cation-transporting ATPase 13A2
MTQFSGSITLYYVGAYYSNWHFIWEDFFLILPTMFLIGMTKPFHKLTSKLPPGKLISPAVISSTFVATATIILSNIIILVILQTQNFYTPYNPDNDDYSSYNQESTTIFAFSNFQYISTAIVFSITLG